MKLPILSCIGFCTTLFLTSCGNSNGNSHDIQYEEVDSVLVEDVEEIVSSDTKAGNEDITPDDVIRASLRSVKSSLPQEMIEGMTITDAYLQGSYLFYQVECDDNIVSVYDLYENENEAHDNMVKFLYTMASNDDNFAIFLAALVEKHMGICYRYVSDESGDYFDIKIKYSELSDFF